MAIIYKLFNLYDKYCSKDYFYLILMSVYHLEILFFVTLLGFDFQVHTFLPMITPDKIYGATGSLNTILNYNFSLSNPYAIMLTITILLIDFIFLYIIKSEIKQHEKTHYTKVLPKIPFINYQTSLNYKEIFFIESLVLYMSIGNPIMRAMLYFMSLNTIQIYIIYRVIFRYITPLKPLFIIGAYISIVKLLIQPIWLVVVTKLTLG
jgi:hypothetical protein